MALAVSLRRSGPPLPGTGCCCCPRLRAPARAPAHAHPVWPGRSRRPGATAVGARPQRSRGRRGRGAKFANNTAERPRLCAQTLASSSGRARLRTVVGQRGRTVAPGPGAPPSRRPQLFPARRPGMRRLAKRQRVGKKGWEKKKKKPIGDRPRLRQPPRPAAALHQKALRPRQPPPSAPAWGWTLASSLTSCRPLRLPTTKLTHPCEAPLCISGGSFLPLDYL